MIVRLTDEQLEQLTEDELDAYHAYLSEVIGGWTLTEKQQWAEDLTRHCFFVGYGGAAGGGKSDWGLYHIYHLCKKIPRVRVLVLRTKLPELKRSLIARSLEKFDHSVCQYKKSDKEWQFHNGSVIEFGYLDTDDDVYQYKSAEYDCIFIDEATEIAEFGWRYLMSRIRIPTWRKKLGSWPHMILCTNPGGPGHAWFKSNFVEATNHGTKLAEIRFTDPLTGSPIVDPVTREPYVRQVAFVPAYVWDNPHMPDEYRLNLLSLDETEMRQLLYGDWDVFAGQFFGEWRRPIHVVRPFIIPTDWTRVRALDYGFRNPYCCLWAAIDHDSNAWIYRETYHAGMTAPQQADQVVAASKMLNARGQEIPEKFQFTNADPATFNKEGSGLSIAQQWAARGLLVRKAKNARIDGWSHVRSYITPYETPEWDEYEQADVMRARLRVFPSCTNLIRQVPNQIHDDVNVEDLKKNDDDHACDTLRYLLMGLPKVPKRHLREKPKSPDEEVWDEYRRIASQGRKAAHPVLGAV